MLGLVLRKDLHTASHLAIRAVTHASTSWILNSEARCFSGVLVPNDSRCSKSDHGAEWEGGDVPSQPPSLLLRYPCCCAAGERSPASKKMLSRRVVAEEVTAKWLPSAKSHGTEGLGPASAIARSGARMWCTSGSKHGSVPNIRG